MKLNQKFFHHHYFFVKKGIFLPRFETEELVVLLLTYAPVILPSASRVLEIGVGSGVVLASLALAQPHWNFSGVDISDAAIKLSQKNFNYHNLSAKLWKSNLFSDVKGRYDLVVANLPYVDFQQSNWEKTVLDWDPPHTLFADNHGLQILENFFKTVSKHLQKNYLIGLEVGINQTVFVTEYAKLHLSNCHVFVKKDLSGIARFVFIYSLNY